LTADREGSIFSAGTRWRRVLKTANNSKGDSEMEIKPLGDRVLVKRIEQTEQIRGGIIIPDTAKEKPQEAEVVAVGDGKLDDKGKRLPMNVTKGDTVLIGKYSGQDIKINDVEHTILREDEILAIVVK
jgi:chaperonin GroES